MFVFDSRSYFNPEVVEGEEPPFYFVRLTPEEEQEIPWANATTMGEFVGQKLFVTIPETEVSDRCPRLRFVLLELVYDKEAAVLMGLHPRLGA
jgi:hypothetical protein